MIRERTARGLWRSYRVEESSTAENLAAGSSAENVSCLEVKTVVASVSDIGDDNGSQDGSESEYITLLVPEDLESQMLSEHGRETTQRQGCGTVVSKHPPTSTDKAVANEPCESQVPEDGVRVSIAKQSATFKKKVTDETGSKAAIDGMNQRTNSRQMNSNSEVSLPQQNESSNMHAFGATPQANTIGGGKNGVQTCSTKCEHASDTPAALTHSSDGGQSAGGQAPAAEIGTYRGHQAVTAVLKNDSRSTPLLVVTDNMCEGHNSDTGLIKKQNDTFTGNETDNNNPRQDWVNSDQTCSTLEVSLPQVGPSSLQASGLTPQASVTTGGGEGGVQTMCSADSGSILNTPVGSVTTDAASDMGQSVREAPATDRSGTTGVSMPLGLESPLAEISYCSATQAAGSNHRPITSTIRKKLSPSRRRRRLPSIPEEVLDTPDSNTEDLETGVHNELPDTTAGNETTAELEDVKASREDDARHTAEVTTTEKAPQGVVLLSSDLNGNGQGEISSDNAEGLPVHVHVHVQDTTDSFKKEQNLMILPEAASPSSIPSTSKDNPSCVDGMESRDDVEHADKKTMTTTTEQAQDTKEAISADKPESLHYNGVGATDTVNMDQAVLSAGESLGLTPPLGTAKENSGHVQTTFTQQDKTMCQPEAGNTLLKAVAGVNPLCNDTVDSPGHGTNKSDAKPYVKPDTGYPDHVDTALGSNNEALEEKLSDPHEIQDFVTFVEGKTEDMSVKSAPGKTLTTNHLILHESLMKCSKEELIAKIAELSQENVTLKAIHQASSNLRVDSSVMYEWNETQEGENSMEAKVSSPEPYRGTTVSENDSVAVRVKLKEMTRDVSELLQEQAELNEEVDNLRQCQEKVDFLILENKSFLFEENGWYADSEGDIGSQADTELEEDAVLLSLREELASTQEQLKAKGRKLQEAEENVTQLTEELDRLKVDRKAAKKPKSKSEKRTSRRSMTSQQVSVLESHMDFSTKVQTILGEVREHVQKLEAENAKLKDENKELELKLKAKY